MSANCWCKKDKCCCKKKINVCVDSTQIGFKPISMWIAPNNIGLYQICDICFQIVLAFRFLRWILQSLAKVKCWGETAEAADTRSIKLSYWVLCLSLFHFCYNNIIIHKLYMLLLNCTQIFMVYINIKLNILYLIMYKTDQLN